jgi:hypothetical protein
MLRKRIAGWQGVAGSVVEGGKVRQEWSTVIYECRPAGPEGTLWTLWRWEPPGWTEIETGFAKKAKCDSAGQKRQAESPRLVLSCWPSGTKPPTR